MSNSVNVSKRERVAFEMISNPSPRSHSSSPCRKLRCPASWQRAFITRRAGCPCRSHGGRDLRQEACHLTETGACGVLQLFLVQTSIWERPSVQGANSDVFFHSSRIVIKKQKHGQLEGTCSVHLNGRSPAPASER